MLTARQIADLVGDGAEIGVHGLRHLALEFVAGKSIEREVAGARATLREKLGPVPLEVFCLPYGSVTSESLDVIRRERFKVCLTSMPGRVPPGEWLLPRFDGAATTAKLFASIARVSRPRQEWRVHGRRDQRGDQWA